MTNWPEGESYLHQAARTASALTAAAGSGRSSCGLNWALLTPLIFRLGERIPLSRERLISATLAHFTLGFLFGLSHISSSTTPKNRVQPSLRRSERIPRAIYYLLS